jgi:hypothetical protein
MTGRTATADAVRPTTAMRAITCTSISAASPAGRCAATVTPRIIQRVIDDLPYLFQMSGPEFSAKSGNIGVRPGKSILVVIGHQTFGRCAQSRDLASLYLGLFGYNVWKCHRIWSFSICFDKAAMFPFFVEVSRCLCIVRRVGFMAG